MSMTFLLSNMSPQTPKLNRYIWKDLEEQVRSVIDAKGEGWVITGNLFLDADSQFIKPLEYIGPGDEQNVAVPTHCFKAILVLDEAGNYTMHGFLMPNQHETIPGDPRDYLITIDRLEQITGYDFFPKIDDDIENELESRVIHVWP